MSSRGRKHDWASLQTYLNAHDRVLSHYAKFMDFPRQYLHTRVTPNYLVLKCENMLLTTYNGNKVRVDISKDVEIDDSNPKRERALTFGYSYNANRPGVGNLIRFDSPDPPAAITPSTPYHHHFHHKHEWPNGVEQILKIADDEWPHVDEFLHEVLSNF